MSDSVDEIPQTSPIGIWRWLSLLAALVLGVACGLRIFSIQ
jgi:hypothetical protein